MTVQELPSSIALHVYQYIPPESRIVEGDEYILRGTGQSRQRRVLSFKKAGTYVPEPVRALLTEEHRRELEAFMHESAQRFTRQWHAQNLADLAPQLQRACVSLEWIADQGTFDNAVSQQQTPARVLTEDEIARTYVLVEQYKRNLAAAGYDTPSAEAKEHARQWVAENSTPPPEEDYRTGTEQDLRVAPDGLDLYAEKNGTDVPDELAALAASENDDAPESEDESSVGQDENISQESDGIADAKGASAAEKTA